MLRWRQNWIGLNAVHIYLDMPLFLRCYCLHFTHHSAPNSRKHRTNARRTVMTQSFLETLGKITTETVFGTVQ